MGEMGEQVVLAGLQEGHCGSNVPECVVSAEQQGLPVNSC